MYISKDPTLKFIYAFSFGGNSNFLEILTFCRSLKEKYGYSIFGYEDKKWRFNNPDFVDIISRRFPDVDIDPSIYKDIDEYRIQQKKNIEKEKRARELKTATSSRIKIPEIKEELYPYQKVGVEFLINNNGKAILADTMGCIAEKMKIIINRGGNAKKYSIAEAYKRFNGLDERINNNWKLPSHTRSLNNKNEFQLNKIKHILYKGKKETLIIRAKSKSKIYEIELTPDHKLITDDYRWIRAEKLNKGDKILVNGKLVKYCPICKKRTEHSSYKYRDNYGKCKKCIYRFIRNNKNNNDYESLDKSGYVLVGGLYFHPNFKRFGSNGIRKHILVYEANENNIDYKKWITLCRYNDIPKNAKFIDSTKFVIHHIDGNKKNNNLKNLKKYTIKEHGVVEGKKKTYRNLKATFIPDIATVISIKKSGIQNVYDIVMDEPFRNFIANGIVVHNCGKTVQALAYVAHQKKKKTLVVCPSSVKYSWEGEVRKWTNLEPYVIDAKTNLSKGVLELSDIFIINYDILKKFFKILFVTKFDCIVFDEFHYLKNIYAKRSKLSRSLARPCPSILLLSGTPLLSRPVELFNGLNLMNAIEWNNWKAFTVRYCDGKQGYFGWEAKGATNIEELKEKISRYFLRRTKEEVLKQLPPKRFIDFPVKLDDETLEKYNLAENSFIEYLREVKKKRVTNLSGQATKLVKLNELRQITALGKISAAEDIIQNIIDGGEKVVVFSMYNKPLQELHNTFKHNSVLLVGSTPELERRDIIKKFQEDKKIKVFFGGIKSAGVGITLTAASNVLFVDYSWVPADHRQAVDRIHRIGQTASSITIYQLFCKNTIDEKMNLILQSKQKIFDQLIENKDISTKKETNLLSGLLRSYEKKTEALDK